jgi:hypothetical protein
MNFGDMDRSDLTGRTEIKQLANSPHRPLLSSWLDSSCSHARGTASFEPAWLGYQYKRVDKAGLDGLSRTPPETMIDHSTMPGILSTHDGPVTPVVIIG